MIRPAFSYNDRTTNNDVALLKLKEKIDFKKFAGTVAPVCLPDLPRKYYDKTVTKSSYNKDLTTPGRSFSPRHLLNFQDDYTPRFRLPNPPFHKWVEGNLAGDSRRLGTAHGGRRGAEETTWSGSRGGFLRPTLIVMYFLCPWQYFPFLGSLLRCSGWRTAEKISNTRRVGFLIKWCVPTSG